MPKLKLFSFGDWNIRMESSGDGYSLKLKHRASGDSTLEEIKLTEEQWLGLDLYGKNKQLFELFPLNFKSYPQISHVINPAGFSEELLSWSLVTQKISGEKQISLSGQGEGCRLVMNYDVITVEPFAQQLKEYFNIKCNQPILSAVESVKPSDFEVHEIAFSGAEKVLVDIIRSGEYDFKKQAYSKYVNGEIDKPTLIEAVELYG